jgi:hypothetical protein
LIKDEEARLRQIQGGQAPGKTSDKGGKNSNSGKILPQQMTEEEKAAKLEKARIKREKRKQREASKPDIVNFFVQSVGQLCSGCMCKRYRELIKTSGIRCFEGLLRKYLREQE